MKLRKVISSMVICVLLLAALTVHAQEAPEAAQDADEEAEVPTEIVIAVPGLRPEGVEYDAAHGRFLVGSLSTGIVNAVADDGTITPFIEDDDLISSVGLEIDQANNRLLVVNADSAVFSDPEATGTAGLAAYDLDTGERLFYADLVAASLEERFFANDVAVDANGNAYVTNSFAPVIYIVTPDGRAFPFLRTEQLGNESFGLNGIEYVPDGYLLAAVAGSGRLYKIQIDDSSLISQVMLSEPISIDGMVLGPDGNIIAVGVTYSADPAGVQEIVSLVSDDDWRTATIDERVQTGGNATTVALRGDDFYYINAYNNNPAQEEYQIVHVDFPEAEG